jgi:hypothetical protein
MTRARPMPCPTGPKQASVAHPSPVTRTITRRHSRLNAVVPHRGLNESQNLKCVGRRSAAGDFEYEFAGFPANILVRRRP